MTTHQFVLDNTLGALERLKGSKCMQTLTNPTSILLPALQLLLIVGGVIALAWWLHRRLGARWATWGWGALSFVGSQVARTPLLIGLTAALAGWGSNLDPDSAQVFWLNLVILTLSAALFEETARYIVLRWLAKGARQWRSGLMFGAGHGGTEALLIFGVAAVGTLTLLLAGDAVLAQLQTADAPAAQVEAVQAQIEAARGLTLGLALAGVWERVVAVAAHVAMSLLVLQTVRGRGGWGYAAALGLHVALNAAALLTLRYTGGNVWLTEGVLTLFLPLSLWLIFRLRDGA